MADELAEGGMSLPQSFGRGNVDLHNRPVIKNPDGSVSTVYSMTIGPSQDGKYLLLPGVRPGLDRVMTEDEAFGHFLKSGEHLGVFDSVEEADKYAVDLHKDQEKLYARKDNGISPAWSWNDEDGK